MSDALVRPRVVRVAATAALAALMLLAPHAASAQDWRTTSYARQRGGEDMLRVNIEYGAGALKVAPAATGTLYRANMRYDAEMFSPKFSFQDGRLRVGVQGESKLRGGNLKEGLLDVLLGPDVPLDLDFAFGATDATIELGGLRVRNADIQTGASRTVLSVSVPNPDICERLKIAVGAAQFEARGLANLRAQRLTVEGGVGEITLDFTGSWSQDLHGRIEMGLGSLTLRVPEGLGLRIVRGGVLASFDSEGLVKRGNVYESQNWNDATHKLSLDLAAALGSVRVVWVDQ